MSIRKKKRIKCITMVDVLLLIKKRMKKKTITIDKVPWFKAPLFDRSVAHETLRSICGGSEGREGVSFF